MTFAGVTPAEVSQTGSFTTSSAADVLVTGMTITPVGALENPGTFLVAFSTVAEGSTSSIQYAISVYVGGVKQRERRCFGNDEQTLGAVVRLVVTSLQAVEFRVRKVSGGGTVTLTDRNLLVHRVNA